MNISHNQLHEAGKRYVSSKLARMGINPAMLNIQVKTSSGRNAPRRWDAGKHRPNASKYSFYVFLNLWDDPKKEIECFVVPSEFVARTVDWERIRPQFKLSSDKAVEFLNRWELISNLFKE